MIDVVSDMAGGAAVSGAIICGLTGYCSEADESSSVVGGQCPTPETHRDKFDKLRGDQGYRPKDATNERWKKDKLHKDHWDVSDTKGKKIKEIDFNGNQIWPDGPKNKNK